MDLKAPLPALQSNTLLMANSSANCHNHNKYQNPNKFLHSCKELAILKSQSFLKESKKCTSAISKQSYSSAHLHTTRIEQSTLSTDCSDFKEENLPTIYRPPALKLEPY